MRIAYVCMDRGVPVFGWTGSSIHVQELIRAFLARGADVELFAAQLGNDAPGGLEAVSVQWLPVLSEGPRATREQAALAANNDLRAALERQGRFDLVYERYSLWSYAGMEFARDTGVPGLLEVNAPLIEQQAQYRGLVDRASAEQVAERVFGASTALIALSKEIASYLGRYPIPQGRVQVIPDGVNPDRFPGRPKPFDPARREKWTVGFLGSLKPWHGLPILVESFAMLHERHPDAQLLIVGDGPERARLQADVAAHGLDAVVHLTGAVPPNEVPALLASMDVAVAPYPKLADFYFSPLKVFEYMAAGRPVVASRIGQLAELIQDGVNGLLCPPGQPVGFALALDRLKRQPELCTRLGRAARADVLRQHTWQQVAQRILHLAGVEVKPDRFARKRADSLPVAPARPLEGFPPQQ
jgi:glycosyltransferase involved in cell wall biosynthesis